jgi:hypothetical protein
LSVVGEVLEALREEGVLDIRHREGRRDRGIERLEEFRQVAVAQVWRVARDDLVATEILLGQEIALDDHAAGGGARSVCVPAVNGEALGDGRACRRLQPSPAPSGIPPQYRPQTSPATRQRRGQ